MPAKDLELYLHVGLQKTGTTTVQGGLEKLEGQLRREGVATVARREMLSLDGVRGAASRPKERPKAAKRFKRQLARLIERNLDRVEMLTGQSPRALFISNEELVGVIRAGSRLEEGFRPRAEATLREVISIVQPQRTHVLLYTRRQDIMLESLYMHQVHAAKTFSFEEFLRNELEQPKMYFYQLAARLTEMKEVTTLRVRPFEIISAGSVPFIRDLLSPLQLARLDLSGLSDLPRKNPSYSNEALRIALKLNAHIQTKSERKILKRLLSEAFPIREYGKAQLLDDDQRRALIECYREDNERLFEAFMPNFPKDSYSDLETSSKVGGFLG